MNETIEKNQPAQSELGLSSSYDSHYNPDRLFAIPRLQKREELGINSAKPPFYGFDCWNHYEVSWLNEKGKPEVGVAEISYNCDSPNIVESKSLKLYFNSFNNTKLKNAEELCSIVIRDLSVLVQAEVQVRILSLKDNQLANILLLPKGICLDDLDVSCTVYQVEPAYLTTGTHKVHESLYSDLLKSNCLVTSQPDWGSVEISYKGFEISHEGLLKYLISFRNHDEFHEQCIERIFVDIMRQCKPESLTVYGRYTRRGGLDINPYRSTEKLEFLPALNQRLIRQ